MEGKPHLIEPICDRIEQYSRSSFELIKLQSIRKTAAVSATLISRLALFVVLSLFVLTLTIAAALWLGDILGNNAFGFLSVAALYGLMSVYLLLVHPRIKARVNNSIIRQMLN